MIIDRLGLKWIEVDLDAYESNLRIILNHTKAKNIIPVIKADAYGHGATALARVCEHMKLTSVAVATLDEAISLRRQFVKIPILVMGALPNSSIPDLLIYKVMPTICNLEFSLELDRQSCQRGVKTSYHLYVDTGMGRMGETADQILPWLDQLKQCKQLVCEGLYSHFAVSDELDDQSRSYTENQLQHLIEFSKQSKLSAPMHIANSGAVIDHSTTYLDCVRPGLLSYGVSPRSDGLALEGLRSVMRLCCKPLIIKRMKAGESVGYGRSYTLERDAKVMTLPVGYADGIPRNLGPHLKVACHGKLYPVVGRVCMDMTMILIGQDDIPVDAEITLMGLGALEVEEWAQFSGRIPYELLTGLGKRWSRCYVRGQQVVDIVRPE